MIRALTITLELTQKFQFDYVRLGHDACLVVKIATFLSTAESIASDFSLVIKIFPNSALRYQLWPSFSLLLFNENASFLEFESKLRVHFK